MFDSHTFCSRISGNLVFNMVRETGDHGPFNSWDRQPYFSLNGVEDGYPASAKPAGLEHAGILKLHEMVEENFFINGCGEERKRGERRGYRERGGVWSEKRERERKRR